MRVLHLGKFYPPHAGGMERHLADLVAAQARSGLDVAALVHGTPGAGDAGRRYDGDVLVERVRCHGQWVFAPVSPAWPLRLARLLREFEPDLLHLHVPNPSAFWALGSREAHGLPWVVHWHADIPDDSGRLGLRLGYPLYRRFERALNRAATRIVATSQSYLDASRALRGVRERCRVIALGLEDTSAPAAAAPAWPEGDGLRVLAVGRLSYYKGFDVLLDAVAQAPGVRLLLVGEGEQRGALSARIERLGIAARVRVAGHLDDATLAAAYAACDLYCLSSVDRAEAFGLVLLEAMRAGKPVLATAIAGSGVGSVVIDGETGLLVAPRDAAALARALVALAAAPARRAAMGAAGRARWMRCYRIDAVTRDWLALYREALAAPTAD